MITLIDVDKLRDEFSYVDSGHLLRLCGPRKGHIAGGARRGARYGSIYFDRCQYAEHRLIWAWHFGPIPEGMEIDHINHNSRDNRIENLRCVTHRENSQNENLSKSSTSGHKGVHYLRSGGKRRKRWIAHITDKGRTSVIGYFATMQEAIDARLKKEEELKWINH